MLRDNLWYQVIFFLFCISFSIYYIVKGNKNEDKKALIAGILLLTVSWSRAVVLFERLDLSAGVKSILHISEAVVILGGLVVAAIYRKKWRPYIIGLGILLVIVIGAAYLYVSDRSPKISLRTTERTK